MVEEEQQAISDNQVEKNQHNICNRRDDIEYTQIEFIHLKYDRQNDR